MKMYSGGQFTSRKLICAFLFLLTIFLSACDLFGGSNNQQIPRLVKAATRYQVYIAPQIGISDISTLDPAQVNDSFSANAIQMIFTGLVQFDDKLRVRPQLAQSWEESANGMTWTFHLKTNLKFSDGKPLTSRDVAYSIDRALQPVTKSNVAPIYLGLIKDSEKLLTSMGQPFPTTSQKAVVQAPGRCNNICTASKSISYPILTTMDPGLN